MPEKIIIPDSAVKYILFQRTKYMKDKAVFKILSLYGKSRFTYNSSVRLKSLFYRKKIKAEYNKTMAQEYEILKKHLPAEAEAILDIGCGIAGIDVLLSRHYRNSADICLLDKSSLNKGVYYGFKEKASFYNSLELSKTVLELNGIKPQKIFTREASDSGEIKFKQSFDLILSLLSWGFHYPVDTYLDAAYEKLKPGGKLIMDIRAGEGGEKKLEQKF